MQSPAKACPAIRAIPGRSEAEVALAAALESGRQSLYTAFVCVPAYIPALTEAGEFQLADRALLAYCQDLAAVLPPNARLFRWSATSVLVLTEEPLAANLEDSQAFPLEFAESLSALARELDLHVARTV